MPTVSHAELKSIIKESVKEALEEEMIRVRLLLFPEVSDKEMLDISDRIVWIRDGYIERIEERADVKLQVGVMEGEEK